MRVMFVSPYPDAGQVVTGGVQAATVHLARALDELGADVRVLVLDRTGRPGTEWRDGGVAVVRRPCKQSLAAYRFFSKASLLVAQEVRAYGPDVVHAQGLGPEAVAVSHLFDVLRVVTPHGDPVADLRGNRRHRLPGEAPLRKRLACRALKRCELTLAIGALPEYLSACARAVVYSRNPVDPVYLAPPNRRNSGTRLLVPAVIKRIKSTEVVLKAASRLGVDRNGIEVRIAGPVSDVQYHAELAALAANMPSIRVTWLGHLDASAMVGEYDMATAMVLGSQWEVSPLAAAEAMVRRCPVVLPDHPGPSEMLGSGERGWLYRAGSDRSLTETLASVLEHPESVEARVAKAFEWATISYAPGVIADETLRLYQMYLAEEHSSAGGTEQPRA